MTAAHNEIAPAVTIISSCGALPKMGAKTWSARCLAGRISDVVLHGESHLLANYSTRR